MLILKPIGRGNWSPLRVVLEGSRASPLSFPIGQRIQLGGVTFRVCAVQA